MTCIAATIYKGKVYMGGDSAGIAEYKLDICKSPKVFRNGPFLIGFTSSFRMGQLLQYNFTPPPIEQELFTYMVTSFVPAVRECFKEGGVASVENGVETGGCFLVGIHGRIFQIHSDFQVFESAHSFDAVGCGADLAKGALAVLTYYNPLDALRRALEITEEHSAGVRGPFNYVEEA